MELIEKLRSKDFTVSLELRPPRRGLSYSWGMDTWIDMYHSIQRLSRHSHIFMTDNAVNASEEENLTHIRSNLTRGVVASKFIPFLTTKHPFQYCMMFAHRALDMGCRAIMVVGGDGDKSERCVPHAYELRRLIRREYPALKLGGWVNPYADPVTQVNYVTRGDFCADFFLTQVVSHHQMDVVETLMEEMERQGVDIPAVFGVFYYFSARPALLNRLSQFLPVPADELTEEFAAGDSPALICSRSMDALRNAGVQNVYLANMGFRGADRRYDQVMQTLSGE